MGDYPAKINNLSYMTVRKIWQEKIWEKNLTIAFNICMLKNKKYIL